MTPTPKPGKPIPAGAEQGEAFALEDALKRLEQIAQQLEGQSPDLEQGLKLYREARALYERCVATLSAAEQEIRVLMADGKVVSGPPMGGPGEEAE